MLDTEDSPSGSGGNSCWNERPYQPGTTGGSAGTPPDSFFGVDSLLVDSGLDNMKCVKLESSGVPSNGGRIPTTFMDMMSCQTPSASGSLVDGSALSTLLLQEGLDEACAHLAAESNGSNGNGVVGGGSSGSHGSLSIKCGLCRETYTSPKVLPCFHTFCQPCLEKCLQESGGADEDKLECPRCHQDCMLTSQGVAGLLSDYAISNLLESSLSGGGGSGTGGVGGGLDCSPASLHCTACKSKESNAIARCFDCSNYLCSNCVMAHQFMHCFEGHRVMTLGELQNGVRGDDSDGSLLLGGKSEKPVSCPRHAGEALRYFCKSCNVPICQECALREHPKGLHHDYEYLTEIGSKQVGSIGQLIEEGKMKMGDLRSTLKGVEHSATRLQVHFHKAQAEINDTFQFYHSVLEERQQDALKELDGVYNGKQMALGVACQRLQESIDRTHQTCEFMERLLKYATNTQVLLFKKLLDAKLHHILNYTPDLNLQTAYDDVEFVSNYQAIQVGVRNTFGYIRSNAAAEAQAAAQNKPQPIARPTGNGSGSGNGGHHNGNGMSNNHHLSNGMMNGGGPAHPSMSNGIDHHRPYQNGHMSSFESNILSKRFSSANNLGPFSTTLTDLNPYEKWSGGGDGGSGNGGGSVSSHGSIFQNGVGGGGSNSGSDHHGNVGGHHHHFHHLSGSNNSDTMTDLSHKLITGLNTGNGGSGGGGGGGNGSSSFPPKSQIKRQKMIYHCKFGEFGVMEGQFTEPSGVAVNAQNDIIVADTNNHRIQIFDKEGRFKFQFGECGKRDGQLLYPNRVSVVKTSGDIIVTERSPTHQIQIYNQYGQFVRKFGANILQHPRGVTVDHKGRVVVVECKVMRVIIFDQMGTVLQKFGCSKHLEFPNGVVVNDKQEIFISDNRAHCVKVFNYEGIYLRQIGGEGITNYPIGVGINQAGEILIADNHNNFNLTIFSQDGTLVNALESKVKHAQCFDVALMDDGSVVLASKDYRLYIYRYLQLPSVGL